MVGDATADSLAVGVAEVRGFGVRGWAAVATAGLCSAASRSAACGDCSTVSGWSPFLRPGGGQSNGRHEVIRRRCARARWGECLRR